MIKIYIAVGLGGGFGAMVRMALSFVVPTVILLHFPIHIFFVNVLGCFFMGLLTEMMALFWSPSLELRAFLTTGFLGGFTTFSAFSLEFALLCEKNLWSLAFAYAVLSVVSTLGGFFIAIRLVRFFAA